MSGTVAIVIGVVVGAITGVFVRRWRKQGKHDRSALAVGALLVVVSLVAGLWLMPTSAAPRGEPYSLGVIPPAEASPEAGFMLAMAVHVRGCGDPVEVTVVTNGTAEYWKDQPHRKGLHGRFGLVIPGTEVNDVRIGMSDDASDIQLPIYASPGRSPFLSAAHVSRIPYGATLVSGQVSQWRKHLSSVVVRFDTDWLRPRGLSSCYLELPRLTGSQTVASAQQALGRASRSAFAVTGPDRRNIFRSERTELFFPYEPRLEVTLGRTVVDVEGGDVLTEASVPGPDMALDGRSTWICESTPAQESSILEGTAANSGGAYSREYLEGTIGTDCSGVAAIAQDEAPLLRDLVLLAIGALFSLGSGMIGETLLSALKQ